MDFAPDARTAALRDRLIAFLREEVHPAEAVFAAQLAAQRAAGRPHAQPPVLEKLKAAARALGLWNLFLPHPTPWDEDEPLTNVQYAPLAELSGRSQPLAPEAMNCAAPDSGNMELLALFGTPEQQRRWLRPLLDGEIRSSYVMTEPDVASSDAGNVATRIERRGASYVLNGRKWWISGAARDSAELGILFGVTDPVADRHRRHSMVLFPLDAPGVRIVRELDVFGYTPWESHVELELHDVVVPAVNLLGGEGAGFAMAQARLGPGRIHHCMRAVGAAELALELMIDRVADRVTFGSPLVEQGVVQEWIARSRVEIDQVRAYTLYTAWLMDTAGNRAAAGQISGIKVAAPRMAARVIDRAIQAFGAAGLSQDTPLARMYADARVLRIVDGPDEVHERGVARAELRRWRERLARPEGVPLPAVTG